MATFNRLVREKLQPLYNEPIGIKTDDTPGKASASVRLCNSNVEIVNVSGENFDAVIATATGKIVERFVERKLEVFRAQLEQEGAALRTTLTQLLAS